MLLEATARALAVAIEGILERLAVMLMPRDWVVTQELLVPWLWKLWAA